MENLCRGEFCGRGSGRFVRHGCGGHLLLLEII